MNDSKRLRDIILQQKQLMTQLEQEANVFINADLTKENETLKRDLHELQAAVKQKNEKLQFITEQNKELKNALFEQIFVSKTAILDAAKSKSYIFFSETANVEINRLVLLEQHLQLRVLTIKEQFEKYSVDDRQVLLDKLAALSEEATQVLIEAKAAKEKAAMEYALYSKERFDALKDEQITDEMVASIGKKNNLEAFIGGNLINKIGIVFIILGIITVSQLGFFLMPDTFRAIIMFIISGAFLAGGEFLNRKKSNIFSLGLTSCGVAGLYASLAISYFMFGIIGMIPALLLCVLITAGAFVLSTRYNSQTIATFALVGGYIPMASISDSTTLIFSAMGYFVILNLLALMISFYKKWKISMFVGFGLNLISTIYISWTMYDLWSRGGTDSFIAIVITYVLFAFAIYTIIPIISCYRTKRPFSMTDVILLGLNTVISALVLYILLLAFDLDNFTGLMTIVFAVVYIGLGWLMERMFTKERHTTALFYLTGLTFVVLVVPIQLGMAWLSLGWLVQAVSLACYGILTGEKRFQKIGYVIGGLCLAAFILFDITLMDSLFPYRYLAITAGSIAILAALIYKKSLIYPAENAYKYIVMANAWIYCMYLTNLSTSFIERQLVGTAFSPRFLIIAMFTVVTFLFAVLLRHIPFIADHGTRIMSLSLSGIGIIMVMGNVERMTVGRGSPPLIVMIIATVVLIILCGLALLAIHNIMMFFVLENVMSVEWLPFGVSAYFLVILTQNLVIRYNMAVTSMALSIIFVIAALIWIIYGFVKRFAFMRRFGLGLSIFAVAKLFLVDLPGLTSEHRIVSYFAFGATLLGISFVYQHFSKRFALKLELEEMDTPDLEGMESDD